LKTQIERDNVQKMLLLTPICGRIKKMHKP